MIQQSWKLLNEFNKHNSLKALKRHTQYALSSPKTKVSDFKPDTFTIFTNQGIRIILSK